MSDELYGIWYTDGEFVEGWLQRDGPNGRLCRWESTMPDAEAQALIEARAASNYGIAVVPIDVEPDAFEHIKKETRQEVRGRRSFW
jgi:hypothetical protein